MHSILTPLLLLLLHLFGPVQAAFHPAGTKIVELTTANFDASVYQSKKPVFVKFYSPGCGHCRNAAPMWDAVSHNLDGHVVVASVNCQTENSICGKFQISGVPSFKLFTQNDENKRIVLDYQGAREADPVIAYANLHMPSYLWRLVDDGISEADLKSAPKRSLNLTGFMEKGSKSGNLPHAIIFRPASRGREIKMGLKSISVAFYGKIVIGIALVGEAAGASGPLYQTKELVAKYRPPADKDSLVFIPAGKDAEPVWLEAGEKFAFTPILKFLTNQLNAAKTTKDEL